MLGLVTYNPLILALILTSREIQAVITGVISGYLMIFRGTKNNFMVFVLKSDKAAGLAWTGTNSSESLTVQNFLSPDERKNGVPMRRQNMNLRRNDSIRDQTVVGGHLSNF